MTELLPSLCRLSWQLRPKHHVYHHLLIDGVTERMNPRKLHSFRGEAAMQFCKRPQAQLTCKLVYVIMYHVCTASRCLVIPGLAQAVHQKTLEQSILTRWFLRPVGTHMSQICVLKLLPVAGYRATCRTSAAERPKCGSRSGSADEKKGVL